MNQLTLASQLLTALGIDKNSPLFGSESWVSWATMLVTTTVGIQVGRTETNQPILSFALSLSIGSASLAFFTSLVYLIPDAAKVAKPALCGLWVSPHVKSALTSGKSVEDLIYEGVPAGRIWSAASRGAARVLSHIALATFAFGLAGLVTASTMGPDLVAVTKAWISSSDYALKQGTIQPGESLRAGVNSELTNFLSHWEDASGKDLKAIDRPLLTHALQNVITVSRRREANDLFMPDSQRWVNERLRYSQDYGNCDDIAASYKDRASLDREIATHLSKLALPLIQETEYGESYKPDFWVALANQADQQAVESCPTHAS